jgi:hypothetical protein
MSLAELFGIKETWRQRMKRARRDWLRSRLARPKSKLSAISHQRSALWSAHLPSPIPRHFVLESLEPRLLLSGSPTPLVLPVEGIVEGPTSGEASIVTGHAPTVSVDLGDQPSAPEGASSITDHPALASGYGNLPLSFEVNQGQTDGAVDFLARGQGYSLFLTGTEAVLSLRSSEPSLDNSALAAPAVLHLELLGANESATITGLDQLEGRVNYVIGNDPTHWHTDIPTYERVFYDEVYDGIDLVFYGNQQQLEYDWIVAPGADASQIGLCISGVDAAIDGDGNLQLAVAGGTVELLKPVAYQLVNGERQVVEASYVLSTQDSGLSTVTLSLGDYDATRSLIIDPILSYSTYLGGSGGDQGLGIAVDAAGQAYVIGNTSSADFPTLNASQPGLGSGFDAFVTKFDAAGARVYSTYLGGNNSDNGNGIAVDAAGNAYVVGETASTNFPTLNASQPSLGGGGNFDAFVTKLDAAGARVYSTYLGGSALEGGYGIAVDAAGNAYVTGRTTSTDFPTLNASQPSFGGGFNPDAFVTKFDAAGARVYSTYLGGNSVDQGLGIAVDVD